METFAGADGGSVATARSGPSLSDLVFDLIAGHVVEDEVIQHKPTASSFSNLDRV